MAAGILGLALLSMATPSYAVCGKECKQAKKFCKNWEGDHPGEECGTVRGAICNVPLAHGSWKKIKQVNWAWSACELVKGEDHHARAMDRCGEYRRTSAATARFTRPTARRAG